MQGGAPSESGANRHDCPEEIAAICTYSAGKLPFVSTSYWTMRDCSGCERLVLGHSIVIEDTFTTSCTNVHQMLASIAEQGASMVSIRILDLTCAPKGLVSRHVEQLHEPFLFSPFPEVATNRPHLNQLLNAPL